MYSRVTASFGFTGSRQRRFTNAAFVEFFASRAPALSLSPGPAGPPIWKNVPMTPARREKRLIADHSSITGSEPCIPRALLQLHWRRLSPLLEPVMEHL